MKLGAWGEAKAAGYLKAQGYEILERNFSCRSGELDLIALDRETVVFVEVKTRQSLSFGLPCESITETKKRHLRKTIYFYMMLRGFEGRDMRVDVLELLLKGGSAYIRHIKNALGS